MIAGHLSRWRDEEGAASLEVVMVMPALILIITFVIQFALWSHATHVALAAAQDGVQAARVEGASAEAGQSRATDFLAQTAPRLITSPIVTVNRDAEHATVVVRGSVASLIPGLGIPVEGRASGPVERFRTEAEGP